MTLRKLSTSERSSPSRREEVVERSDDSIYVELPAKVVNPFINLRPMPKRPAFLASPPPATPTLPGKEQGQSKQAPIEIDSDSDSSSVVEIIDLPIIRPRTLTKKVETTIPVDSRLNFRNASQADKVDLKRLKRQLEVATDSRREDGTTEPKIFKYIPTERDRYLQADTEGRNQILRRARTHLLFRVLRDLESL